MVGVVGAAGSGRERTLTSCLLEECTKHSLWMKGPVWMGG